MKPGDPSFHKCGDNLLVLAKAGVELLRRSVVKSKKKARSMTCAFIIPPPSLIISIGLLTQNKPNDAYFAKKNASGKSQHTMA